MFDHDSLYNYMYNVLRDEVPNFSPGKLEHITNKLSDAVSEWVPKKGDVWLTPEGNLYINKGWEEISPNSQNNHDLQSNSQSTF